MLDLLDTRLDPREVEKAMDVQMSTLVEKDFAKPRLKADMPRKAKLFNFNRVDEIKRGVYRHHHRKLCQCVTSSACQCLTDIASTIDALQNCCLWVSVAQRGSTLEF